MIKQRKPMAPGSPLERKTELRRTGWHRSSGPVKPRKPGRSREESLCRKLLPIRSGGVCEIQVPGKCQGFASVASHRKRRSQSSRAEKWSATNVLHGCPACEMHLTDFGATAAVRSFGWTVHPSVDPAAMPVFRRGSWVWLTEGGGVIELDLMEIATWGGAA